MKACNKTMALKNLGEFFKKQTEGILDDGFKRENKTELNDSI